MDNRGRGTHWILDCKPGIGWAVMYTGSYDECRDWLSVNGYVGYDGYAYYMERIPLDWDGLLGIVCYIPDRRC